MKTVILTNKEGESLDKCEIIEAHTNGGKLHKAFSAVIFNIDNTRMLIQQRAEEKMLWPGYWSNTCCSHPKEEKSIEEEAATRLQEECGFTCPLTVISSFVYKAEDPNGSGTEHEYDTILVGETEESTSLDPDPSEIADMKWVDVSDLQKDLNINPDKYSPWFHDIMYILYQEPS
jgi:isopentenyl-diphosphate delta-isomerase